MPSPWQLLRENTNVKAVLLSTYFPSCPLSRIFVPCRTLPATFRLLAGSQYIWFSSPLHRISLVRFSASILQTPLKTPLRERSTYVEIFFLSSLSIFGQLLCLPDRGSSHSPSFYFRHFVVDAEIKITASIAEAKKISRSHCGKWKRERNIEKAGSPTH